MDDKKELASELQFLFATDLNRGTVNKYTSSDSIGGDSSQKSFGAFQNNHERNIRCHNEIIAVMEYARWVNWMTNHAPALLPHWQAFRLELEGANQQMAYPLPPITEHSFATLAHYSDMGER